MFQFPSFALLERSICQLADGLPHSDIRGSLLVCSSPQLIAALHVLLRLCMPRHPPCALSMLLLYGLHGVSAAPAYISIHAIGLIVGRMGTNRTRLPWRSTFTQSDKCPTIFCRISKYAASDLLLLLLLSSCQRTRAPRGRCLLA